MQKKPDPIARWGLVVGVLGVIATIIAGLPSIIDFIEKRTAPAQASNNPNSVTGTLLVTFSCQNQFGQWVTVPAQGNSLAKKPLFIWQTSEFGDNFTPEKRCQIVSDKLTQAVRKNGGDLSELSLKYGQVKGEVVICVSKQEDCTNTNMLLTLSRKNVDDPEAVLTQIIDFAQNKTSNPSWQKGSRTKILLEDLVKFD